MVSLYRRWSRVLHCLTSRMKCPVYFFQIFPVNMGVDVGRRDIGMTEHLLDRPEISPAFQQVRREGMTERVGMNLFAYSRELRVFLHDVPDGHARHRSPAGVE